MNCINKTVQTLDLKYFLCLHMASPLCLCCTLLTLTRTLVIGFRNYLDNPGLVHLEILNLYLQMSFFPTKVPFMCSWSLDIGIYLGGHHLIHCCIALIYLFIHLSTYLPIFHPSIHPSSLLSAFQNAEYIVITNKCLLISKYGLILN